MKSIHLSLIAGAVIGLATTGCEHTAVTNTDTVSGSLTSKFVLSKVKTTNGDKVTEVGVADNSAVANDSYTQDGLVFVSNANSDTTITFDINYNLIEMKNVTANTVTTLNTSGLRTKMVRDTDLNNTFVEDTTVYNPIAGNGFAITETLDADNDGLFDTVTERNTTNSIRTKSGTKDSGTYTEYASNGYKVKDTVYSAAGEITSTTTYMPTATALVTSADTKLFDATTNVLLTHTISNNGMLEYNKSFSADGQITKEVNFTYGTTKVTNSEFFNRNGGITQVVITNHADTNASLNLKYTFEYNATAHNFNATRYVDTNLSGAYDSAEINTTKANSTIVIDGITYNTVDFVSGAPTKYMDNNYTLTYTGSLVSTVIQDAAADGAELNVTYDANGYRSERRVNANSDANVDTITTYTNGVQTKVVSDTNSDGNINSVTVSEMGLNNSLRTISTITYDDSASTTALSKKVSEVNATKMGGEICNINYAADGTTYKAAADSKVNTYDSNYNLLTQEVFDGARSTTKPYDSNTSTYEASSFNSTVKLTSTHISDPDADGVFENKVVRSWGTAGMALARYIANANTQNTLNLAVVNNAEAWFDADEVSISIYKDNQTTAQTSMIKTYTDNGTTNYRSHVDGFADTVLAPTTNGSGYSTVDVLRTGKHLTKFVLDQEGTANDETREFTWEAKERQ